MCASPAAGPAPAPAPAGQRAEPADPAVRVRRLRRRGRLHEALAAATEALDGRGPVRRRAALLVEAGEILVHLGDDSAADRLFVAALEAAGTDRATAIRALTGRVGIARFAGRLDAAEELLARFGGTTGLDALGEAQLLLETGLCRLERNDPAALTDLRRAVELAESGPAGLRRSEVTALALDGRAAAYRVAGDYAAARTDLDRALPPARRGFGRLSMEVAQILNARGMIGKFSGAFEAAEADYRAVARLLATLVGPDHPEMAALHPNVAGLAHARGDFAAAEAPARRSLEIRIGALGEDHVAVALDRSGLASILDRLGRPEEAERELRLALPVLREALGRSHREVAVAVNNLAAIAQGRGDLGDAEALYREALAIKEETLGSGAPSVGISLSNLASVVRRRGNLVEAAELVGRAIEILEATVAPGHPALRAAIANRERIRTDRGGGS